MTRQHRSSVVDHKNFGTAVTTIGTVLKLLKLSKYPTALFLAVDRLALSASNKNTAVIYSGINVNTLRIPYHHRNRTRVLSCLYTTSKISFFTALKPLIEPGTLLLGTR